MKLFHEAAETLSYHPYRVPTGNVSEEYTNVDGEQLYACQYCESCGNYGLEDSDSKKKEEFRREKIKEKHHFSIILKNGAF